MAKIGLIDLDGKNFPNIPLMKISAFHKQKGDNVDWITIGDYDKTYISKIFTFSPDFLQGLGSYGEIIKGAPYRDWETDRKSTRLNSSHRSLSRMPSSA